MDLARTLFIGMLHPAISVRRNGFLDDFNVHEFEFVVWNAQSLANEMATMGVAFSPDLQDETKVRRFEKRFSQRLAELTSWVADGHTLVIVPYLFPRVRFTVSGSTAVIDLNDVAPFSFAKLTPSQGVLVEAREPRELCANLGDERGQAAAV